jgi:hypothetical protein
VIDAIEARLHKEHHKLEAKVEMTSKEGV